MSGERGHFVEGLRKRCGKCGALYNPPKWQQVAFQWECPDCYAKRRSRPVVRARRLRWQREYAARPEIKARNKAGRQGRERILAERERSLRRYYNERHTLKHQARRRCADAIKQGRLSRKPCSVCGNKKSHAHHHDYGRPFDVTWLCDVCHKKVHRSALCADVQRGREKEGK